MKFSLKNQSGVWLYQTNVCPRNGIPLSSQNLRVVWVPEPKTTWVLTLFPCDWQACWLIIKSGFNSFSGVILLKCFLMKSDPTLNSLGLTDVPILNLSLNASLSESDEDLLSSVLDEDDFATSITA